MSSLSREIARLKVLAQGQAPEASAPTFWTPVRITQWQQWVVRLLESMPQDRAGSVYTELTTLPAEQWGTLTRVVDREARTATMGAWDSYIGQGRPVALPEAVCAVLEAQPDADVRSSWDCERCGFETPVLRRAGSEYGQRILATCPLCAGDIHWQGFNAQRWYASWQEQLAELGTV